jgi:AcrR family transcriptional regulator
LPVDRALLHTIGTFFAQEIGLARPAKTEGRTNDADETRNNILEVATREYADKGLAGARIDEIAEKTSSSKRMIYYYFGGKDELYRAVLEKAYTRIRAQEFEIDLAGLAADQALRAQIEHTFDYHAQHPDFVRLVMNENIHHGQHIAHVPDLQELNRSVIALLKSIIDQGVSEGLFRADIDPVDLHMSISALCFYNVSNRYTFASNFGVDFGAAEFRAKRRAQVADIVLAWVRK